MQEVTEGFLRKPWLPFLLSVPRLKCPVGASPLRENGESLKASALPAPFECLQLHQQFCVPGSSLCDKGNLCGSLSHSARRATVPGS